MKTLKTVYETTDGKLWKDKTQAKRHEAWLDLNSLASGLLGNLGELPPSIKEKAPALAQSLLMNGDELRRILRADPTEGGGDPEPPKAEGGDQ